ncbi:hypothetical protein ZIOFF_038467 [Zingiber officinale]|uniref:DYW domain-containing protein n=1 Tax=Zingiber officinale TaxID=94328 RepID=A0A8J5L2T9_ZINOF|nr:hypothetical protein ZIOFF_038467 [Zingiber officinale]
MRHRARAQAGARSNDPLRPRLRPAPSQSLRLRKQLHSHALKLGFSSDVYVQNTLMNMYSPNEITLVNVLTACARARDIETGKQLFDEMPERNIFCWNIMIKGHVEDSDYKEALRLCRFHYFKDGCCSCKDYCGLAPNAHTFPFLLKGFTRDDDVVQCGYELHAHAVKFGLSANSHVRNALLRMYAVGGKVDSARELFDSCSERDVVLWNAMISGYNRNTLFEESCRLFVSMARECVRPNGITYISVLSACAKMRNLDCGKQIHQCVITSSHLPELRLQNALIEMYQQCSDMEAAWRVFVEMPTRDVISWTALVVGFAKSGEVDRARELFDQMPQRDLVSWTAMINGYVAANKFKAALEVFRAMQVAMVRPDAFTMVTVLTACAQLGALEVGEWIRTYMDRNQIKMDIAVGNALIDMYSKCGCVKNAVEVFDRMTCKDRFTWTAIISGLALNGHGEDAIYWFYKMVETDVRPDGVTYIGALTACAHAGLVDKGRQLFSSMITRHGIMPNVTHYGCLVDLLSRSGQLEEALETINNMPMKPNSAVWGALLAACRVHGNLEIAELAGKHLLRMDLPDSAAYLLLSNIYAKSNKFDEAHEMREAIRAKGIRKEPGCSSVEMNGEIHEFVAGDRSHPRSSEIYSKLEEMSKELNAAGYVADTSEIFVSMVEKEKANAINEHSERLAIAFGLISSESGATIRVAKNLRICVDCHNAMKFLSEIYKREIVVRDRKRFHRFINGLCSCNDYW